MRTHPNWHIQFFVDRYRSQYCLWIDLIVLVIYEGMKENKIDSLESESKARIPIWY